jgi:hypothetical protein
MGIEAKSCSDRAEAVPLLILEPPAAAIAAMAATNKCLAQNNKSHTGGKATNKRICVRRHNGRWKASGANGSVRCGSLPWFGHAPAACTAINMGQLGCPKQLESECVTGKAALEQSRS